MPKVVFSLTKEGVDNYNIEKHQTAQKVKCVLPWGQPTKTRKEKLHEKYKNRITPFFVKFQRITGIGEQNH